MSFGSFDEVRLGGNAVVLDNSLGTGLAEIIPASQYGVRLDTLVGSNNDAIDHVVAFAFDFGGGIRHFGSVSVPAGSGYGGVSSVDLLAGLLPINTAGLTVEPSVIFECANEVSATVAGSVTVSWIGGWF